MVIGESATDEGAVPMCGAAVAPMPFVCPFRTSEIFVAFRIAGGHRHRQEIPVLVDSEAAPTPSAFLEGRRVTGARNSALAGAVIVESSLQGAK